MSQSLFFIHIPKTAGTSFRIALEQVYGKEKVCADYGPNSADTSALVKESVYQAKDFFAFYQQLEREFKVLCGHVHASKYVGIVPVTQMVTFLRDPVKRVISEYRHFVRNNDYEHPLKQFYESPSKINVCTKFLKSVPINAVGFAGLAEAYNESIALFNKAYQQNLTAVIENVDPEAAANNLAVDQCDIESIQELNQQDLELYAHARKLFETRLKLDELDLPYTYADYHMNAKGQINGWSFRLHRNAPLSVELLVEDKVQCCALAQNYHGQLHRLGAPRKGHVAFSFQTHFDLQDNVSVRIQDTKQVVMPSTTACL